MRRLMKLIMLMILLGSVIIIYLGISIYTYGRNASPKKSDCILVLGCRLYGKVPSPFLRGRLDESLRLYREGYTGHIIVSGGKGPGEDISEAEAMKAYLVKKGVISDDIIIEDKSTSTMTNISNSKSIMKQKGFMTAIIVSNRYHLKRASLMSEKLGVKTSCSGVYMSKYPADEFSGFIREILALLKYYLLGS